MKLIKIGQATLVAFAALLASGITPSTRWADAGDAMPATQPSTRAAGFSITGQVRFADDWNLGNPDLGRVVVFLDSDPVLDAFPPPTDAAVMAQHRKMFDPGFLAVARNTVIEFPNWDHFSHNVFSRSKAAPAFDLERYPYGQSKSRRFDKVGIVQVFCNIHPQMRAIIFVAPNVFFARVDTQGRFVIPHVPPGKYDLVVWQQCAGQHRTILVESSDCDGGTFTLSQDRNSILANDPPQRHEHAYGPDHGLGVKRETLQLPVVKGAHPAPMSAPSDE